MSSSIPDSSDSSKNQTISESHDLMPVRAVTNGQPAPNEQSFEAIERQDLDRLLKLMLAGHKPV